MTLVGLMLLLLSAGAEVNLQSRIPSAPFPPAPVVQPRMWSSQKALCAEAFLATAGRAALPNSLRCANCDASPCTGYVVAARLLLRDGLETAQADALANRVSAVVQRAVKEDGGASLASRAGAQIVNGETPYFEGYLGEALRALRDHGFRTLATPIKASETSLGQSALATRSVLRAARLSGHLGLRQQAVNALKNIEQYAVHQGASASASPLYQPDLLAAAHAISAYMDAYQITGDPAHVRQAVYWAKTGLPFVYLWSPSGHPAMLYNTIPVFGSTWFTHSWIGVPVVWCGLVYAYALQDLAPYDQSFDWRTIAQGITNSAMHQQYTDGPSKGCYPDSWNVLQSKPIPADINPENIVLNECRLRGNSAALRTVRVPGRVGEALINSIFDMPAVLGSVEGAKLGLVQRGTPGFPGYTTVAPAQAPAQVQGAGNQASDSAALASMPTGWLYDREAQALILKHTPDTSEWKTEIIW